MALSSVINDEQNKYCIILTGLLIKLNFASVYIMSPGTLQVIKKGWIPKG